MKAVEILNKHNLKRTSCREGIIEVMMNANQALSENEIREKLSGNYDRTTFYRSFITLEENKIIHKIVLDNQTVKYAVDNTVNHNCEHAHFYCNDCKTIKCMDSVSINKIQLPEGFTNEETKIIIKGKCANCNKS